MPCQAGQHMLVSMIQLFGRFGWLARLVASDGVPLASFLSRISTRPPRPNAEATRDGPSNVQVQMFQRLDNCLQLHVHHPQVTPSRHLLQVSGWSQLRLSSPGHFGRAPATGWDQQPPRFPIHHHDRLRPCFVCFDASVRRQTGPFRPVEDLPRSTFSLRWLASASASDI